VFPTGHDDLRLRPGPLHGPDHGHGHAGVAQRIGGTNQPTSLGGPGPLSRGLRFCGGGHGWISGVPRRGKAFPRTRREARQPLTAPGAWLPEPEPAFPPRASLARQQASLLPPRAWLPQWLAWLPVPAFPPRVGAARRQASPLAWQRASLPPQRAWEARRSGRRGWEDW